MVLLEGSARVEDDAWGSAVGEKILLEKETGKVQILKSGNSRPRLTFPSLDLDKLKFPFAPKKSPIPSRMTENLTGTELVADGLIKRYGKREVLKGVSLNAKPGEIVGLLGPNGAGKTTTFSILAGFTLPDAGSLRLGEIDLTRLPPHKRAKKWIGLFTPRIIRIY